MQIEGELQEEWFDVPEYEGIYIINKNDFRIKRVKEFDSNGRRRWFDKTMTPLVRQQYYSITLGKNGRYQTVKMHRIIAKLWVPNPNNHPIVNHLDGNKLNNNIENLEWCTHGDNMRHAYKMGMMKGHLGKRYTKAYRSIICLDANGDELAIFKSATIAARLMRCNRPAINNVISGRLKSYRGFTFEYAKHVD